jgi:cobalt/nickel transport system ATP-binding protein
VEKVFEVENVTYCYNDVTALADLSLSVNQGQRVAILGANGCGKSTLLRLLDGLYFPQSGSIKFFQQPLTEEQLQDENFFLSFRRRVALVFQNPDVQLFCPTVFDEVAFGPLQLRWPKDQIRKAVRDILNLMEISHLKDRSPHRLSGGEKKRVALASVLVLDPAVLLLDEPTAALDPKSESQVIDLLISWGSGAKTVITTTHSLDIVEEIADYCYVFRQGSAVAEGAPRAILNNEELLLQTNLIHAHQHKHGNGEIHSHPHKHFKHEHS